MPRKNDSEIVVEIVELPFLVSTPFWMSLHSLLHQKSAHVTGIQHQTARTQRQGVCLWQLLYVKSQSRILTAPAWAKEPSSAERGGWGGGVTWLAWPHWPSVKEPFSPRGRKGQREDVGQISAKCYRHVYTFVLCRSRTAPVPKVTEPPGLLKCWSHT